MSDLVFVTHNHHKISEIRGIFQENIRLFPRLDHFRLLYLDDIGYRDDIPETMDTLEGNASMKAWTVYRKYGMNCFADDTGLEVDALEGRPGVMSARYAGETKQFDKNIMKLLHELNGKSNRKARFRTVIALIIEGRKSLFEGIIEGSITKEKRGYGGFGYDPVFIPDPYTQTFAEMPPAMKNRISHRFKAMYPLMAYLNGLSVDTITPQDL